jgi:hypothetical protein
MAFASSLQKQLGEIRIAESFEDGLAAFSLVYSCYVMNDYFDPHPARMVYHNRFASKGSRTLVAVRPGRRDIIGTMTIVGGLDCSHTSELNILRRQGARLAEITAVATAPDARSISANVFLNLTRFMFQYVDLEGFSHVVMVVHPRHQSFYEKMFGARAIAACRPYPLAANMPGTALLIGLHELKHLMARRNVDWIFGTRIPREQLKRPPMSIAVHSAFQEEMGHSQPDGNSRKRRHAAKARPAFLQAA